MTTSGARYCGVPTMDVSIVPASTAVSPVRPPKPTHFGQAKVGDLDPLLAAARYRRQEYVLGSTGVGHDPHLRLEIPMRDILAVLAFSPPSNRALTHRIRHRLAYLKRKVRSLLLGYRQPRTHPTTYASPGPSLS